jgi:hypothetical protein
MNGGQVRRGRNRATDGVRVVRESNNTSSAFATEVNNPRLFEAVLSDARTPILAIVPA